MLIESARDSDTMKTPDRDSLASVRGGLRSPDSAGSASTAGRRALSWALSASRASSAASSASLYPSCPTPAPSHVDTLTSCSVLGENGVGFNRKRGSSIYSDINIAIFPSDMVSADGALFPQYEGLEEGDVLPCSPSFQPLSASVLLLGAPKAAPTSASEPASGLAIDRVSPTFITLPNTGSIIHPVNGWVARDPSAAKSPQRNGAFLGSGGAWLLRGLRSGAVAPAALPAVDVRSLSDPNGVPAFLKVKARVLFQGFRSVTADCHSSPGRITSP